MNFYDFGRGLCNLLLSVYFNIEVKGLDNFPKESEGLILISNHSSYLDPVMLGLKLKNRNLTFMAKDELFHVPILAPIIKKLGAFPVKRGKQSRKAIIKAKETVMEKKTLALFPEGHRSKTGELLKPKSGVIMIAAQTKSPIMPAAIYFKGKYPRAKVKVYYAKPMDINSFNLPDSPSGRDIKQISKKVWSKVEELYESERK